VHQAATVRRPGLASLPYAHETTATEAFQLSRCPAHAWYSPTVVFARLNIPSPPPPTQRGGRLQSSQRIHSVRHAISRSVSTSDDGKIRCWHPPCPSFHAGGMSIDSSSGPVIHARAVELAQYPAIICAWPVPATIPLFAESGACSSLVKRRNHGSSPVLHHAMWSSALHSDRRSSTVTSSSGSTPSTRDLEQTRREGLLLARLVVSINSALST